MKKKLKAFTLIELIVVMAILAILMSALMNFYRPIRETFVDSTMIEDLRTTQDGILEYVSENIRYAEQMMIFDQGSSYTYEYTDPKEPDKDPKPIPIPVNNPSDAYKAFAYRYGYVKEDDPSKIADGSGEDYEDILKKVKIIVLNRGGLYDINGYSQSDPTSAYSGRIITNILSDKRNTAKQFTNANGARPGGTSDGDSFMALGGAYYGNASYNIYINTDKTWKKDGDKYKYTGSLTFTIQSGLSNENGVIKNGNSYGNSTVEVKKKDDGTGGGVVTLTTDKTVLTKNLSAVDYYTGSNLKIEKVGTGEAPVPAGTIKATKNVTNGDKNTFIVYLEPDENLR
ncbi:MAG: type II secretion system protein [Oscillospiraceae bacterium]